MSLFTVYSLLETDDQKVKTIHDMVEQRVLVLLPSYGINVDVVPKELDYIIDELTIQRYNRIGSEGMKVESSEGYSTTYVEDELANYSRDLTAYAIKHGTDQDNDAPSSKNGGWRFF